MLGNFGTIEPTRFDLNFSESDSDDDARPSFTLSDKLASRKFPEFRQHFVKDMRGDEVDLAYFQR
jgi:hypothetical protein